MVEGGRSRYLAEPRLHAAFARVVAAPQPQGALERVSGQLFGQATVARQVDEVGQDVLQVVFRRSGETGHVVHTPPALGIVTGNQWCPYRGSGSPRSARNATSIRRGATSGQ